MVESILFKQQVFKQQPRLHYNKGLKQVEETAGDLEIAGNKDASSKKHLKVYFTAAAVGLPPNEMLARTQGAVINPNLELLFKGPTLDLSTLHSRWVQETR